MNIELIKYPTDEDWMLVKTCTLVTVGKKSVTPPTAEWKRKLLIAQHSPIRELRFVFKLTGVPYWVSTHLVRHHVGFQPYVKTQRNDRQSEYDRTKAPQDAPVDMIISLNAEALITLAKKRLCAAAAPETRAVVFEMCQLAMESNPEFNGLLRPACEWQGMECHEMFPCGRSPKREPGDDGLLAFN